MAHPSSVPGPARRRWIAYTAMRVGATVAAVVAVCWLIVDPSRRGTLVPAICLALMVLLMAGRTWMWREAWEYVPGAHGQRSWTLTPSTLDTPDWIVTCILCTMPLWGALAIAGHIHTDDGRLIAAFLGGLSTVLFAARLGSRVWEARDRHLIPPAISLLGGIAWCSITTAEALHIVQPYVWLAAALYGTARLAQRIERARRH